MMWVSGNNGVKATGFCGPFVFGCNCFVVVNGGCDRDCRGLGLCKVGIVSWSADGECLGGWGVLVTGWGRIGGEGENRERVDGKCQQE
jgi:hypothetical protein